MVLGVCVRERSVAVREESMKIEEPPRTVLHRQSRDWRPGGEAYYIRSICSPRFKLVDLPGQFGRWVGERTLPLWIVGWI